MPGKPTVAIDPTPALEAAAGALLAGDDAAALPQLLAAWRAVPAPELAALIETVSERAAQARPPVEGKTLKARHQAFLALAAARDPADLPRLHAVIPTLRSAEAAEELDALLEWPADPRHTPFFVNMIRKPPYRGSSTAKVWRRVFDLLLESADPRLLESLPALDLGDIFDGGLAGGAQARDITQRKRDAVVAKLGQRFAAGAPRLPAAAQQILERIGARTRARRCGADELLARILEAPDDDQAKLVYADALQEAGDPRGELIALQFQKLSRALTSVDARREKALIHDNFARWFGALAPVVIEEGTVFEKGFPVRVRVALESESQQRLALGHPLWATVRTLDINHLDSELPLPVLLHPAMRSLSGVINLRRGAFSALAQHDTPLPWSRLGYWGPSLYADEHGASDRADNDQDRRLLCQLHRVLPSLTRLSLSGYLVGPAAYREWLWDVPLVSTLQRLDVSSGVGQLAAWVAEVQPRQLPKLRALGVPHHWSRAGWDCCVEHGDGGPFSVLRAHMYPKAAQSYGRAPELTELARALAALPENQLTAIYVTAGRVTKAGVAEIEREARRQKRLVTLALP